VVPEHGRRAPRPGEIGNTAIVVAVGIAAASVATVAGLVRDMPTLADLFSIFAFPVMLLVYYVARRISQRSRRARETALLEEDKRDMAHLSYMIRMCRQLALGLVAAAGTPGMSALAVLHMAEMAGTMMSRYGHLVSSDGKRPMASVQDITMEMLGTGGACGVVSASALDANLSLLSGSMLDPGDPSLVERRRRAADSANSAPA